MTAGNAQREYGVLYLIGRDRVGILQDAADFVGCRGAAVEEGISHTLSTEAIVVLYVSGTTSQLDLIERETAKFGEGLALLSLFTRIKNHEVAQKIEALPLTLRVASPDFSGLMAEMTRFFTKHGLTIIGHHTHKSVLPLSQGSITYHHRFTVLLPSGFNRKRFIAELDELAHSANFIRDDISQSDFY